MKRQRSHLNQYVEFQMIVDSNDNIQVVEHIRPEVKT